MASSDSAELAKELKELREEVKRLREQLQPVYVPMPYPVYPRPFYPWYPPQPMTWCGTSGYVQGTGSTFHVQ